MPRGKWEGHVFKRPTRCYWEGQVRLCGRRFFVTGRTRGEVVEKLRALVYRHTAELLAPPTSLTLAQWCRDWLVQGKARWRPTTWRRRAQVLVPLMEKMGHIRLTRLSPLHVLWALDEIRQRAWGAGALSSAT